MRALSTALAELYAPGLDATTYVDRVFTLTSKLIPLVLNSHGLLDHSTRQLTASFDRHPPGLENAFSAFGQFMHKYAPFRFDPTTNDGRPFSVRDFFTKPGFEDLDIYQEVYGPMGYSDHCFVNIPAIPGKTVFIGFFRDGGIFSREEKELLELLQPHLANARQLAFAVTAANEVPLSPELFHRAGYTPRECDVIYWLTQGKSNDEIAELLRIRADSVSRNLQAIYIKMGVEHRVAATLHALALAKRLHAETIALRGGDVSLAVDTRSLPVEAGADAPG